MDANGVRNDFLRLGIFSPHFLMNKSPFIYFSLVIANYLCHGKTCTDFAKKSYNFHPITIYAKLSLHSHQSL